MPSDDMMIRALLEAAAAIERAVNLAAENKRGQVNYRMRCAHNWCKDAIKLAVQLPIDVRDEQDESEVVCD
jgi:hypothetical protein